MDSSRIHWPPLIVLLAVCALASAAIWLGPGILNTRAGGDSPFLLIRTYELAANLRAGVFPARWMPDAAYGLGYPFFNFYAALPYYLAAALTVLGVDMLVAIKLTQTAGMFAAGVAMLVWARIMLPRWAATLASCAYVFAPFHLVNVYVRGDSLSEFWAFVWFPLILWGVQRNTQYAIRDTLISRITYGVLLALALAALVLTHNVSALIFAPFIVIYAVALLLRPRPSAPLLLRNGLWLVGAAALALALSAWFWLPALAEAPTVQLGDQTTGYFNFANHFRAANLVQPSLAFNYAVNENGNAFAMGLLQTAFVIIGAVIWWLSNRRAKQSRVDLMLMLALFALATFMLTPLSEFIWARAPLLPLAQFPWRFLSVQAVFAAVLIGGVGRLEMGDWRLTRLILSHRDVPQSLISILCVLLLLLAALIQLPNERLNIVASDVTPRTLQLYEWYTGNIGTTIRGEYLPKTALPRPYVGPELLEMPREALIAQDGLAPDGISSRLESLSPTQQIWRIITTRRNVEVTMPLTYWWAWDATINGITSDSAPFLTPNNGSGWVRLLLTNAGENHVTLTHVGMFEQGLGNLISLVALGLVGMLLGLAFVSSVRPAPTQRWRVAGVIAVLGVILLVVLATTYAFQPRSEDLPTLQTLDFAKRPFPHRDPAIFRSADGASYELIGASASADEPLRAGGALTLSLQWRDDRAPAVITVTQELPMGGEFANLFRYAREQSGGDPRLSTHTVPSNTLPGPLLLKLQASDAAGNLLTPFNPDGSALMTPIGGKPAPAVTLLGPSVTGTPPNANAAPPHLHTFANGITLHEMDWLFASEQEVCFRPVWAWARDDVNRADALQVSLRLRGSDGREIATADGQPQAGLAPTWSWPAGVLINDGRCVPVQNLLNLGEPYTLQIVWYRLANLEQVAEVTLRGAMSANLREDKNYPKP